MSRWILAAALAGAACAEHSSNPLRPSAAGERSFPAAAGEVGTVVRRTTDVGFTLVVTDTKGGGGSLMYDIQNGFVYEGDARDGNLILNVHDGEIRDASDTEVFCRFRGELLEDAATGEVIYKVTGFYITPSGGTRDDAFRIRRYEVYQGWPAEEPLATASEDLSRMSDERKLLVAALLSAECGAPPLIGVTL